ncbi:MAG: hypothetical protein MRY21_05480 [Simkaniaceae bacterium]|nr:hypothetical protein [Simkaniaceae bacterium]
MPRNLSDLFKRAVVDRNKPKVDLKRALGGKVSAYVLIYCDEPGKDGSVNVEMVYEGDRALAAYLLHTAQGSLD